jgi:hypothetical protein
MCPKSFLFSRSYHGKAYCVANEHGCKFVIPLYDFKELFLVENRFFC